MREKTCRMRSSLFWCICLRYFFFFYSIRRLRALCHVSCWLDAVKRIPRHSLSRNILKAKFSFQMRSSTSSLSSLPSLAPTTVSLYFPANTIPDSLLNSIPRKVVDAAIDCSVELVIAESLEDADVLLEFTSSGNAFASPLASDSPSSSTSPSQPFFTAVATVRGSTVNAFTLDLPKSTPTSQNDCAVPTTWPQEMTTFVLDTVLGPREVLLDVKEKKLTSNAVFALRRAFWLLDKDKNGFLNKSEASAWPTALLPADLPAEGLSESLFLAHASDLLQAGHHRAIWEVLKSQQVSTKTALPYVPFDTASVKVDDNTVLYLSHVAVQFFVSLYQLDRFPRLDDMWRLVPGGCPWSPIASLPSSNIPLDQFMECWKLMTWLNRDAVIKCARTWGFRGEPQQLFTKRKCRAQRSNEEALPNSLKVLVVGSPHCGRSSLINALCERPDVDDSNLLRTGRARSVGSSSASTTPRAGTASVSPMFIRTITVPDEQNNQPVTLIYVKLPDVETSQVLITPALQKQYDVVLLCFEGCDPYSCSYWMERFKLAAGLKPARLPFVLVGTKCDVPLCEQATESLVDSFCRASRLSWPPLYTSGVVEPQDAPCGLRNEIDQLNELVAWVSQRPEHALAPPEISTARYARRVLIVLSGLVLVTVGVRTLLSILLPRRSPGVVATLSKK